MTSEDEKRRRTYDVPDRWSLPALVELLPTGAVELSPEVERPAIRYFDTTDRDLTTFGATLLRDDSGWTLTLPTDDGPSVHREPAADDDAVPAAMAELTSGIARGRRLTLLASTRTDRVCRRWVDDTGTVIVEVADDTVHLSAPEQGAALITSRRQITLDLGPAGRPGLLRRIAGTFTGTGAITAAAANDPTGILPVASPSTDQETGSGKVGRAAADARTYLKAQDVVLIGQDVRLRSGDDDVHAVRVATRRMRSTLRVFAELFDPVAAAAFDGELSWYATLLGEIRDRQVQRARFADALAELPDELVLGPVAATIEQHLLGEEIRARKVLHTAMTGKRYHRLLRTSADFTRRPPYVAASPKGSRQDLADDAVRRAGRKTLQRLDLALATGDDEQLHRARRAAKRARYAAELSSGKGRKNRKAAERFKELQEILGEHQDSMVAAELLRRLAAGTHSDPTQNGFTFGILYEQESRRASRARRAARRWRHR